ncbi:MAG TPA: hypothetical protein VMM60_17660 [Ilumatobacter sp.]|nr:hypothetical protein [Ilumatobacter sp.]
MQALRATLATEAIAPQPQGYDKEKFTMIKVNDITDKISLPKFDLPKIDLTNFDLSKVKLPKFDTPKFDVPKFELPKFELPKFELPKFELPKVDVPKVDVPADVARVADFARDAAYVSLGAVVVTVKAVDERRRELSDQVAGKFRKVVGAAA